MTRMKPEHSYQVQSRKIVFSKGPIHLVDCLVSVDGQKPLSRQIIEHPGAVVILPKAGRDKYILIRQFRFAAKDWLWEFPAGGIEKGETRKAAAKRELMEEIGLKPGKLTQLISFYPTPGVSGEVMHLFLAEKLTPGFAEKDADEDIEQRVFTLSQIGRMIHRGQIKDGKTILGYYLLKGKP